MWMRLLACLLLVGHLVRSGSGEESVREVHKRRQVNGKAVAENCQAVTLPQYSTKKCKAVRKNELKDQRAEFEFVAKPPFPMPLANFTLPTLQRHYLSDSFGKEHFLGYVKMLQKNKYFADQWIAQHPEEITEFQGYENMFNEFRSKLGSKGSTGFYRFASNTELFRSMFKDSAWRDDDMFADQRLSGINPMLLRRVTDDSSDVGLKWSELKKILNPSYNWESVVQVASGSDYPLNEAIKEGKVYVLRYELYDGLPSFPDSVDHNPDRTLWPSKSPVALFVTDQGKRLRPAAIQIDYKPDSPVFSPVDGGSWMLAKMVVQTADYIHSQIIEHLLKIHLFAEPFCVVLHRQLSSRHPLNELLKYHCRGLIVTNTIGGPQLIIPNQYMDRLSAIGRIGTISLIIRGYETLTWKDADFKGDIKERGVDDRKLLPYFPYRDDSNLLYQTIRRMVWKYVRFFYRGDRQVKRDYEIQAYVNEISAKGRGQVKDFPAALKTRREVVDMVTKLLWLLSVKHAAVNFPVGDYGAFTPVLPTKVYNDTRVPIGEFSIFNLPNGNISSTQALVAMNVALYHYDTLFDYHEQLSIEKTRKIVRDVHNHLKNRTRSILELRNRRRFRHGHLTYPYLQHPWLPNGVQT